MIRILEKKLQNDDVNYYEFAGSSKDTKPEANVCTGSVFIEVDTGDVYLFDEAETEWNKVGGGDE